MNWNDIPADTMQRLLSMYELRLPLDEQARILGVTPKNLIRRLQEYRTYSKRLALARNLQMPASSPRTYTDYEVLEGDDWLIISDLEVPDHDPSMIETIIRTGARFGIKRLVIAGDLIAGDQRGISSWPSLWAESYEASLQRVLTITKTLLKLLHQQFEDIYFISGNHDERIGRSTGGHINIGMLLEGMNVNFSHYAYLFIETSRGPVYICHPQNFSKNPVKLGQELYTPILSPSGEKCHIVLGHCHRAESGASPDGLREVHALGCIRDPEKTKYKMLASNKHYKWTQGFLMIREGFFYPLTKRGTDWRGLLGEFASNF